MDSDPRATEPSAVRPGARQFGLRRLLAGVTVCGVCFALLRGTSVIPLLLFVLFVGICVRQTRTPALLLTASFVLLPGGLFLVVIVSPWLIPCWLLLLGLAFWWTDHAYRQDRRRGRAQAAPRRE